jgi:hypothetical protein
MFDSRSGLVVAIVRGTIDGGRPRGIPGMTTSMKVSRSGDRRSSHRATIHIGLICRH